MNEFPSIRQYRHVIKTVQLRTNYAGEDENGKAIYIPRKQPTLKFRGTVKLHGTNAAIVQNFDTDGGYEIRYQSRHNELTLEEDNAGFCAYMKKHEDTVHELLRRVGEISGDPFAEKAIFGELAGAGTVKGKRTAVSHLDKFFSIFKIKIGNEWQDLEKFRDIEFPEVRIFNNLRFGCWEIPIDFERPYETQNVLADLTLKVEEQCPAGHHFGVDGTGEGIVWECIEPGWDASVGLDPSLLWFKVKGEKHSVTRVRTLAQVDVEVLRKISDFVDATVTEPRLEQGLQVLVQEQHKPFDKTTTADFIRWLYNDILKEEADTIAASELDPKKLGSPIANKARKWFMEKLAEQ